MCFIRRLVLAIVCLSSPQLQAVEALPDRLDYKHVMKIVDEGDYYESLLGQSELGLAASDKLLVDGLNDFNINLVALAQYVKPSEILVEEINDDHRLSIVVQKTLTDFGFSDEKSQAVEARVSAAKYLLKQIRLSKRLDVASKFFDIKLSDLKFSLDNEAIATAYVKYHKTQEKNDLKQASDVELLEAEFEYQQVRARRYESETLQRISRARFAESISRPDDLPDEVILPDFSYFSRKRPEYDDLLKIVMSNNLQIRAQQQLLEAASHELSASRKKNGSVLSTELELTEYSSESPTKNNWKASLKYSVPLYENDSAKAVTARALSEWQKQKARLQHIESEIRQQLLEVWQQIHVLKARQDIDEVAEEYRELYQDRSRAYYEMEYRTDLGDSFVRVSEARLEKFKNNFNLALAWMKLSMLTGVTLEEYLLQ